MTETRKLDLVQHIRPLHLMTLIVLYFLGVGFGRYLGQRIDPAPLWFGLLWILNRTNCRIEKITAAIRKNIASQLKADNLVRLLTK